VKKFIADLAAEARKQPRNLTKWEQLCEVQHRAARIDPAYYPEALESYRHVLELAPEHPTALRGMASAYYELTDYANALPLLEKYLTIEPDDPGAGTDLATVRLRLGDSERAIADYRKVIAANPAFVHAHINLGAALHQLGRNKEALEALRQARTVANDDPMRMRIDELIAELEG
jgi:tetratricopeptide (TPR) repeat protein